MCVLAVFQEGVYVFIEEPQNVGYSHNEMLKLLELNVTDYIIVINKGKGKLHRC